MFHPERNNKESGRKKKKHLVEPRGGQELLEDPNWIINICRWHARTGARLFADQFKPKFLFILPSAQFLRDVQAEKISSLEGDHGTYF